MRLKIDAKEVLQKLEKYGDQMEKVALEAVGASMAEAEREAKLNAPWTDRTGNARNSIAGTLAEKQGDTVLGHLLIGVYYGVFLELKNHGKYRIVFPTIEWEATRVPIWIKNAYDRNIASNL